MTALAALETGNLLPSTSIAECTGSYTVPSEFPGGEPQVFHNVDPVHQRSR